MKELEELTAPQSLKYNDIITKFYDQWDEYQQVYLRFGQAFYNWGYKQKIFTDPYPDLFYCENNQETHEMIVTHLCEYVKEKV